MTNVLQHILNYGWWAESSSGEWERVPGGSGALTKYFGQEPVSLDVSLSSEYVLSSYPPEGLYLRTLLSGLQVTPPWPLTLCSGMGSGLVLAITRLEHVPPNLLGVTPTCADALEVRAFYAVDGEVQTRGAQFFVGLDSDGQFLWYLLFSDKRVAEHGLDELSGSVQRTLADALMGFAFCHTRGSDLSAEPRGSTRAARRRARHKKPLIRHHVLKVKQVEDNLRRVRTENPGGGHNAFHLCRGHFVRYTKEKPLFGKFVGQVWRSPHFRGQDRKHLVTKDYAMGAPHEV